MADTVEDSISKALNIPTVMRDVSPPAVVEEDDDFEYARRNMRDIIEEGKAVLAAAASLAQTSESPRAFEEIGRAHV